MSSGSPFTWPGGITLNYDGWSEGQPSSSCPFSALIRKIADSIGCDDHGANFFACFVCEKSIISIKQEVHGYPLWFLQKILTLCSSTTLFHPNLLLEIAKYVENLTYLTNGKVVRHAYQQELLRIDIQIYFLCYNCSTDFVCLFVYHCLAFSFFCYMIN